MPLQDLAAASPEDELARAFPGSVLTHVLSLTAGGQLDVALEALSALKASGASLEALHLSRTGDALDHRLTLVGLTPHQARQVSNRLAALPGVTRVAMEHQLIRR